MGQRDERALVRFVVEELLEHCDRSLVAEALRRFEHGGHRLRNGLIDGVGQLLSFAERVLRHIIHVAQLPADDKDDIELMESLLLEPLRQL